MRVYPQRDRNGVRDRTVPEVDALLEGWASEAKTLRDPIPLINPCSWSHTPTQPDFRADVKRVPYRLVEEEV